MDNLKELAQQNGNQAAAVMVPYHESSEIANSPITATYDVYGKVLQIGNSTFSLREDSAMDGSMPVNITTFVGRFDWEKVQAIFTNTPVLCLAKTVATCTAAFASITLGGTGDLENYIQLGGYKIYKPRY